MDDITKDKIVELGKKRGDSLVSIYMPAHKAAGVGERNQDALRFKNLTKQAEELLLVNGLRKKEQKERLQPLQQLIEDREFWAYQHYGLAVFVTEEGLETYRLPLEFKEAVTVSGRLLTKPLYDFLGASDYFYILAMSLNEVRLFRANRYDIEELAGSGVLPTDINDALGVQDNERILQHSPNENEKRGARGGTVFHGHGGAKDLEEVDLNRFVEAVAKAVTQELRSNNAPLIFAGVEELFPKFKEKCGYKNLLEGEYLPGNHENTPLNQLHKSAVEIISPLQNKEVEEAIAAFEQTNAKNPERATAIPADIYHYAAAGKIETLVMAEDKFFWGALDEHDALVEEHQDQFRVGDVDLLDQAAQKVLSTGGKVLIASLEKLPENTNAAAILRY